MELLHRWKVNIVVHVFEDWAPQKDFIKRKKIYCKKELEIMKIMRNGGRDASIGVVEQKRVKMVEEWT